MTLKLLYRLPRRVILKDANKIGIQFHPENLYNYPNYPGLNRHKQLLDNVFGIFEGYYRSMQHAKKMGIDRETAKAAIQKVNQELIEHLESCSNEFNKNTEFILSGKQQNAQYESDVKKIVFLPGITSEDIAITREGDKDLLIYFKAESGQLKLKDRYDMSNIERGLRLEFADGSVIELNPQDIPLLTSFSADELFMTNKMITLSNHF